MLTISAPIEIKAKSTYLRDPEAFYHRITGNYSLMETQMNREDLLHIATTPPEIYVAEGEGMTSILSRSERNETNINKVDILNNVINRIVVSADSNLTYQDRVFITDALYRLGVRDDRRFMENFYQMAQETRNTNTLINLYLQRGGQLRELINTIESSQRELVSSEREISETEKENFLYNSVFNRLKTGAIYQIVSNFNRTVENKEIDGNEYSISNQSYTAQHILLSVLRERAGVSNENLFYLNGNTYEESLTDETTQLSMVKNEMTSAVLMDMLQNIYHTGFDRFYTNNEAYYRFEDTFFRSADQTFVRLINNIQADMVSNRQLQEFITENRLFSQAQITLPENIEEAQLTQEDIQRISEVVYRSNITDENRLRELFEQTQSVASVRDITSESRTFSATETEFLKRVEEGTATTEDIRRIIEAILTSSITDEQRLREVLRQTEKETEIRNIINDSSRFTSTQMELLKRVEEGTSTQEDIENIRRTFVVSNSVNEKRLQNLLTQTRKEIAVRNLINSNNMVSRTQMELLRRVEEGTATEEEIRRITESVNYSSMRNEEKLGELIREYERQTETENIIDETNKLTSTEIELLEKSTEGGMTEEEIRRITETVDRMNVQNELRRRRYVQEINRIRKEHPAEPRVGGIEMTRRDAKLALSDPQKLIEELQERRTQTTIRQNTIINELQSIFPDQSMEVYQLLNRMREGDVSLIENNIIRPADVGELMYDISSASQAPEEPKPAAAEKSSETREFIEAIRRAREEESSGRGRKPGEPGRAETVHRQTQTLTTEELNEQLSMMQNNISKQIHKTVESDVITENHVTHTTQVINTENQTNQLRRRDIEQLIENGVKSQMNTLSNQVINKIERQMRNEKMRRGF